MHRHLFATCAEAVPFRKAATAPREKEGKFHRVVCRAVWPSLSVACSGFRFDKSDPEQQRLKRSDTSRPRTADLPGLAHELGLVGLLRTLFKKLGRHAGSPQICQRFEGPLTRPLGALY